jgi:hypothetical protein
MTFEVEANGVGIEVLDKCGGRPSCFESLPVQAPAALKETVSVCGVLVWLKGSQSKCARDAHGSNGGPFVEGNLIFASLLASS